MTALMSHLGFIPVMNFELYLKNLIFFFLNLKLNPKPLIFNIASLTKIVTTDDSRFSSNSKPHGTVKFDCFSRTCKWVFN